jgi:hypothetical protein
MTHISVNIQNLYNRQFGTSPSVPAESDSPAPSPARIEGQNPSNFSGEGSELITSHMGREIWLPVKFTELSFDVFGATELLLPYAVVKISQKKNIVRTPMAEHKGTVKELYSVEDTVISIKGFIIGYDSSGKYPQWPEAELRVLQQLFNLNEAVKLDNAKTNLCIEDDQRVVITSLEFPEVQGGRKNVVPFILQIESDTVFELTLK